MLWLTPCLVSDKVEFSQKTTVDQKGYTVRIVRKFFAMSTGQGVAISMTVVIVSVIAAEFLVALGEFYHHMYRIGEITAVTSDRIALEWHQIFMVEIMNFCVIGIPLLVWACVKICRKSEVRDYQKRVKGWVLVVLMINVGIGLIALCTQLTLASTYSYISFYVVLDQVCSVVLVFNVVFVVLLPLSFVASEVIKGIRPYVLTGNRSISSSPSD